MKIQKQFKKILIKLDKIPDSKPGKAKIIHWGKRYWINKTSSGVYRGAIDINFALDKLDKHFLFKPHFHDAIRSVKLYIASHEVVLRSKKFE